MTVRPSTWSTRRQATTALILVAVVSFVLVGTVALIVAHRVARSAALAEGLRTARGTGRVLLAPVLPAVVAGDREAIADLEADIARRRAEGTLLRVKVWSRDGTVLWSDNAAIVGSRWPLRPREIAVFDERHAFAEISPLTDAADADVRSGTRSLVEAYIPLQLGGRPVALEMYFSQDRVRAAEAEERTRLVGFSLAGLLVLACAQLPVSIWLMRRISRAQHDRDRMRETALVSSDRERRLLARSLHDGVVQELAATSYLVSGAAARAGAAGRTELAGSMDEAAAAVRSGINGLRSLLVDIYPPSLEATGLQQALSDLVDGFATHDVAVRLVLDTVEEPDLDRSGRRLVFQVAQEAVRNAVRHSGATTVDLVLESTDDAVRLLVTDDGAGFDLDDALTSPERGHFGLRLLLDAARENGADLWVATAPGAGTSWCLEVRR